MAASQASEPYKSYASKGDDTRDKNFTAHHGIPKGKDDPFVTLENLHKLLGCQSLGNHHLVHKPGGGTGVGGGYH